MYSWTSLLGGSCSLCKCWAAGPRHLCTSPIAPLWMIALIHIYNSATFRSPSGHTHTSCPPTKSFKHLVGVTGNPKTIQMTLTWDFSGLCWQCLPPGIPWCFLPNTLIVHSRICMLIWMFMQWWFNEDALEGFGAFHVQPGACLTAPEQLPHSPRMRHEQMEEQ